MGALRAFLRWDNASDRRFEPVAFTAAGWGAGVVVTALILWSPHVAFGYRSPSLHLVLDSVDACVALLCAYLVHGRFVREQHLQDFLLAQGLILLAIAGIFATAVTTLGVDDVGTLDVWFQLALRVGGAVLIAAAALAADRPAPWSRSSARRVSLVTPLLLTVVLGVLWLLRARLPLAVDPTRSPPSLGDPLLAGHPLLLLGQGSTALCLGVASLFFTVQAMRDHDELLRWLGPACGVAAFARLNYLLFPSLYSDWLYTGDLLRTAFYLLLLVGAAREIRQYWDAQAAAAVLEDRRRLARELHDGVIQELTYIRAESRSLPAGEGPADRIVGACDRALDEARAAVTALGHAGHESLAYVLHRSAKEVMKRYGGHLDVELDDSVTADPEQQHALVRITREATSNALRHGAAQRVRVSLGRDGRGRELVIQDDGTGFDVEAALLAGRGFGLISMRDRARGLGGTFRVESVPGRGTEVRVTW